MRNQAAFTLIEVLIAVAVLGIALIASVSNTSTVASDTAYLQERTIAHWVAMDVIAQTRTGLIAPPSVGGSLNGDEIMLAQTWHWHIQANPTAQPRVIQIQVSVINTVTNKEMDQSISYILLPAPPSPLLVQS